MAMECECGYFLNELFVELKQIPAVQAKSRNLARFSLKLFLCNSSKHDMIQVVKAHQTLSI